MGESCKDCGSVDLVPRGKGFKNRCRPCLRIYNRECYHANRAVYLKARSRIYKRNAPKRRAESKAYKAEHRERYTILEWFRKKGVSSGDIDQESLSSLVEMKKALKAAKIAVNNY